jgi:hypothetical protein
VTKGKSLIQEVRIRNPLKTNIISSKAFEEVEACVAAGMDIERWDDIRPEVTYPRELKIKVIAWYRLRGMIEAHVGDTQVEYQKREAKKAQKKR